MLNSRLNILLIILILSLVGCNSENDEMRDKENTQTGMSASWAYPFVKWNNETYVVTEEVVSETNIGKRIGEVTVYLDEEGTYGGNFSNIYKEGTEYYEISNINTKELIAIKNDKGQFIKAVISDKNENKKNLEEVTIYKMDKDSKRIVITDKEAIKTIKTAIKSAEKQPGIVNMADPQYKINLGDEIYFLWLTRSGGTIGIIMNAKDTGTIYSLSEKSTTQLNELLLKFKLR
ncbi:hypothetical protein [Peribacillus butanolivorans]